MPKKLNNIEEDFFAEEERGRDRTDTRSDPRGEASKERAVGLKERIPVGAVGMKMTVNAYSDQLEGKKGRWFNHIGDRIQRALAGGYDFVNKHGITTGEDHNMIADPGTHVSMVVGNKDGKPLMAYYMAIPMDFYEADQKAKQDRVDAIDQAIHSGTLGGQQENAYLKKESSYKIGSRA